MTNREEAIRLARAAGGSTSKWGYCCLYAENLERLIQLAKNEAFKEAAKVCLTEREFQEGCENFKTANIIKKRCEAAILSLIKE